MGTKSDLPLEPTTVKLYRGDKATIQEFFPGVGHNAVIRALTHQFAKRLREMQSRSETSTDDIINSIAATIDLSTLGREPAGD